MLSFRDYQEEMEPPTALASVAASFGSVPCSRARCLGLAVGCLCRGFHSTVGATVALVEILRLRKTHCGWSGMAVTYLLELHQNHAD